MFEKAAMFSALLVFTSFSIASIKFLKSSELEKDSPIVVFKEMFPKIDTTNN